MSRSRIFVMAVGVLALLATPAAGHASNAGSTDVTRPFRFFLQHGYMVGDVAHYDAVKYRAARAAGITLPSSPRAAAASPSVAKVFEGTYDTAGDPPDTTGAVGPQGYVEAVNSAMAVYSKSGTFLGGNTFDKVLGSCHTSQALCEYSDPQVLYDSQTHRFYYEDLNADVGGSDNYFEWGFSKTSHPTTYDSTQWCNYKADFGYGTTLPDYPKMGQSSKFLIIGVNDYVGEAYSGSDIDTISKPQSSKAITTCPPQKNFVLNRAQSIADCNPQGQFAANLNPAQAAQPSSTGWVVADPDPTNSGFTASWIDVIKVTPSKTAGKPTIGAATCVTVPQYAPPPPAVQMAAPPIPPYTIDTLDGRLTHAMSAPDPRITSKGHLAIWTSHTVAGGAGSEVDWYEVDPVKATAFQTGVISDPNLFVYNAAIASDRHYTGPRTGKFGSGMVVGFSTSGQNAFPAIQMVSKRGPGPQSGSVMIKASPGPDASFSCSENPAPPGKCRWGDYSGASPDLFSSASGKRGKVWLDNQTVTGEDGTNPISGGPTWRTWIWRANP